MPTLAEDRLFTVLSHVDRYPGGRTFFIVKVYIGPYVPLVVY